MRLRLAVRADGGAPEVGALRRGRPRVLRFPASPLERDGWVGVMTPDVEPRARSSRSGGPGRRGAPRRGGRNPAHAALEECPLDVRTRCSCGLFPRREGAPPGGAGDADPGRQAEYRRADPEGWRRRSCRRPAARTHFTPVPLALDRAGGVPAGGEVHFLVNSTPGGTTHSHAPTRSSELPHRLPGAREAGPQPGRDADLPPDAFILLARGENLRRFGASITSTAIDVLPRSRLLRGAIGPPEGDARSSRWKSQRILKSKRAGDSPLGIMVLDLHIVSTRSAVGGLM
jgi:hypothetical protein